MTVDILNELEHDEVLSYWINPLVDGKSEVEFDPVGEPVSGQSGLYRVTRSSGLTQTEAATTGRIYIQNASSFLAVKVLDPQPDEEILDLAAAPGGKTIAIAAAMTNTGRLAAVEPVKQRFFRLKANLERCGVTNVQLYQRDGRGVGRAVPDRFDRVLLDAPCSSESHMRWNDPSSYRHWSLRKVKECQRKQKGLIRSAYQALKPGGVLVYCTCSFAPEENEAVVDYLLKRSSARVTAIPAVVNDWLAGLTEWQGRKFHPSIGESRRILPRDVWDGFYLCRIEKPA